MNKTKHEDKSLAKIEIISYVVEERKIFDYQGFDTLFSVDNEKNALKEPRFITGIGVVRYAPDELNVSVNDLVAFCGFTRYEISGYILISPRCFARIPESSNSIAFSLLGHVTRIMALINSIDSYLGKKVLLVANKKEKILYKRIFIQYGLEVIDEDYLLENSNSLNQNNSSKIDLFVIASDKDNCLTRLLKSANRETTIILLESHNDFVSDSNVNKFMKLKTLGKGYYDYKYMMGETEYNNAYIQDNVQYNINLAVNFIKENIELIMSLIELAEECTLEKEFKMKCDKNDKFFIQYSNNKNFQFESNKGIVNEIKDERVVEDNLVDFKKIVEKKINPAIIEFTFNAHRIKEQDALYYAEEIMNQRGLKLKLSAKNDIVTIYKAYGDDGTLLIINLINNSYTDTYRIEAHIDGSTYVTHSLKSIQVW